MMSDAFKELALDKRALTPSTLNDYILLLGSYDLLPLELLFCVGVKIYGQVSEPVGEVLLKIVALDSDLVVASYASQFLKPPST